jgi:natural product precursor
MKEKKQIKKLVLGKETIADLKQTDLSSVKGGRVTVTLGFGCTYTEPGICLTNSDPAWCMPTPLYPCSVAPCQ